MPASSNVRQEGGISKVAAVKLLTVGAIVGMGMGFFPGFVVGRMTSSIPLPSLKERFITVNDSTSPNAILGPLVMIGVIVLLGSQQLSKTARKIVIVTVALGALALLAKPALVGYLATKAVVLLDPKVRLGLLILAIGLDINHIITKGWEFEF